MFWNSSLWKYAKPPHPTHPLVYFLSVGPEGAAQEGFTTLFHFAWHKPEFGFCRLVPVFRECVGLTDHSLTCSKTGLKWFQLSPHFLSENMFYPCFFYEDCLTDNVCLSFLLIIVQFPAVILILSAFAVLWECRCHNYLFLPDGNTMLSSSSVSSSSLSSSLPPAWILIDISNIRWTDNRWSKWAVIA